MRTKIMKLIPGLPACFGRVKMIPATATATKLAVFVLLAGSSLLWSCSDPVPAIELDRFMSLALSGAKETSVVKKLNLESTADTVFYITMTYGGTNNYERGEITATLDVDYSLVEAFNAANYTEYRLLPEGTYSFDRTDARIANGRNASEPVKLTLRMNALNLSFDYLLPVTVKSVSGNLPLNEEMKTLYLVFRGDVEDESGRERWTGAGASSEGENNPVENVFDGDRDTYWHSGEAGSMPQWFAVNMQGFKRIKGFTWVNCTDPAQPALPKHVQIETSMNGTEWTQALDVPELEQSRVLQVLPLEQTVVAKFFRVTVLSNWADAPYTYVAEVDIYSGQEPEGETDFAKYNWTVDGFSSELMAVWGAACAIDGTINPWHTAVGDGFPQWIIIDFHKTLKINGIIFQNSALHGSTADHPKHVKWEASNDKENWTTILEIEELPYAEEEQLLPCTTIVSMRYLRLSIMSAWTAASWTYVGEMSIY